MWKSGGPASLAGSQTSYSVSCPQLGLRPFSPMPVINAKRWVCILKDPVCLISAGGSINCISNRKMKWDMRVVRILMMGKLKSNVRWQPVGECE